MTDPRRRIPSVETLLGSEAFEPLVSRWGRTRVASAVRGVQADVREQAAERVAAPVPADGGWYAERVAQRLERLDRPSLRRVVNATGVVLHTNLGRAALAEPARRAVADVAGYASLEYDLETGGRGSRHDHCVDLLRELTGAEAALVVNNNAAAVLLALNTLSLDREVVVSRGELVEIGGSFRLPTILARSGAVLREVGATNRTHPSDYRDALGPRTGLLLKVHRSNFRMEGYTAEVPARELAALGEEAGVPLVHDLGAGALVDLAPWGFPPEPTADVALSDGAAVVTMSGDKLLGGPQAGIVVGGSAWIEPMRRNPLARALRPGKLTLAALEATLRLYRDPGVAEREVPAVRMLVASAAELAGRAERLVARLREAGVAAETAASTSAVGGGAYPTVELPTTVVVVGAEAGRADALARALRRGDPPVAARVRDGRVLLDPRTVAPTDEPVLVAAVAAAAAAVAAVEPGAARAAGLARPVGGEDA